MLPSSLTLLPFFLPPSLQHIWTFRHWAWPALSEACSDPFSPRRSLPFLNSYSTPSLHHMTECIYSASSCSLDAFPEIVVSQHREVAQWPADDRQDWRARLKRFEGWDHGLLCLSQVRMGSVNASNSFQLRFYLPPTSLQGACFPPRTESLEDSLWRPALLLRILSWLRSSHTQGWLLWAALTGVHTIHSASMSSHGSPSSGFISPIPISARPGPDIWGINWPNCSVLPPLFMTLGIWPMRVGTVAHSCGQGGTISPKIFWDDFPRFCAWGKQMDQSGLPAPFPQPRTQPILRSEREGGCEFDQTSH